MDEITNPNPNPTPEENGQAEGGITPKTTGNIPTTDLDFANLNQQVAAHWAQTPQLTLLWTTQADYSTKASTFATTISQRMTTGAGRKSVTNDLKQLDSTINKNLIYLKNALKEKYGKEMSESIYPQFGIVKRGTIYTLPNDRDQRLAALLMLKDALTVHQLTEHKYGTPFWNPIVEQYSTLKNNAGQADGTVSQMVGTKEQLKAELRKVLNALMLLIRANYPDTAKSVLREWGFQKEKY
jgi:hypothetical protein